MGYNNFGDKLIVGQNWAHKVDLVNGMPLLQTHFLKFLRFNAWFALGVCVFFFFLSAWSGWHYTQVFFEIYIGVYGIATLLSYSRFPVLSAWMLYIGELSGVALISCLFGRENLFQIMFLLLMIFPFLYFENSNKWVRYISAALPFPILILLEWTNYSWWPKETAFDEWAHLAKFALLGTAFLVQWFMMYYYGKGMHALAEAKSSLRHQQELADEYKKARDIAEKASQLKGFLLTAVSHEFRTPLHSISMTADLLKGKGVDEDSKQWLEQIGSSSQRLAELLGDIMDLACIKNGELQTRPACLPFSQFMDKKLIPFRLMAEQKGLELVWSGPADLKLSIDGNRLEQFLRLVLDNAIKFSPSGQIQVIWDDNFLVRIVDQGPGIPTTVLDHYQEDFIQGQGGFKREFGGIGIGLGLAHGLALALDAQFVIRNLQEGGCEISLALPRRGCVSCPKNSKKPTLKGQKILIVEDQAMNAKLLKNLLQKMEYDCKIAENGQIALDYYSQGDRFDLVFMDLQMPVMDGFECTRQLRLWSQQGKIEPMIILALSANTTDADRQAALKAGVDGFMCKPISKTTLEDELKSWQMDVVVHDCLMLNQSNHRI